MSRSAAAATREPLELTKEEYEEAREKEDLFYRSYTVARGPMPEGYEELNLDDPEAVYALYRKEEGEYDDFDEEGNLLSTYNPNSKWDWDDNYRARFIDTLDPEDEIQIFDCHI